MKHKANLSDSFDTDTSDSDFDGEGGGSKKTGFVPKKQSALLRFATPDGDEMSSIASSPAADQASDGYCKSEQDEKEQSVRV